MVLENTVEWCHQLPMVPLYLTVSYFVDNDLTKLLCINMLPVVIN